LQEEGYYPFGLEMKAISSAAAMKLQTRYKFNAGTELEASFDVDYYETYFRQYDAQIGRFTGIDALAEKTFSETPYHFAGDNPINFNDPSGAMKQYNESGRPMRDRPTNWNPQLRILPEEYTSFWDDYWSDPFEMFDTRGGNAGEAGPFTKYWSNVLESSLSTGVNIAVSNNGDGTFVGVEYLDDPLRNYLNQEVAGIINARNASESMSQNALANGGGGPGVGLELIDGDDGGPGKSAKKTDVGGKVASTVQLSTDMQAITWSGIAKFGSRELAKFGDYATGAGAAIVTANLAYKRATGKSNWKDYVGFTLGWTNVILMKADQGQGFVNPITDVATIIVGVVTVGFDAYVEVTDN
jgi:RHS repeat-associated protein